MKTSLTLFITLIFSLSFFTAHADERELRSAAMLKFYQKHKKSGHLFVVNDSTSSSTKKLIEGVSSMTDDYMLEATKSGEDGGVNFDHCSNLCVVHGTSKVRTTAAMSMPSIVDLSQDTRECQKFCKAYQLSSYAYRDGFDSGLEVTNANTNCAETVNTTSRKNGSMKTLIDVTNEIKDKKNMAK